MSNANTTRQLTHPGGPVTLDLDAEVADIHVIVGDVSQAHVELTGPSDDPDVVDLIERAVLEAINGRLKVRLPHGEASAITTRTTVVGGGTNVVQIAGRVTGTVIGSGDVYMAGGRVIRSTGPVTIINGRVINGSNVTVVAGSGIRITARLPHGSSLDVQTTAGTTEVEGQLVQRIEYQSVSGDLHIDSADQVDATSVSGDLHVDQAPTVTAKTTSGDIRIGCVADIQAHTMSGDVAVGALSGTAQLRSMSGNTRVHAVDASRVHTTAMSGDITVSRGTPDIPVEVTARSMSGRVRTPNNGNH